MVAIGFFRGAEVHRDAVLHDVILLKNLIEDLERPSAIDHEIFGDDFEPVTDRLARKNVVVVGGAQADTDSVVGKSVEFIRGHLFQISGPSTTRYGVLSQL